MPSPKRHHRARRFLLYTSALLTLLFLAITIASYTPLRRSSLTAGPLRPFVPKGPPDPNATPAKWERDETHHVFADGWYQRRFYPVYSVSDFSQEPQKTLNSVALQWATYENAWRPTTFWRPMDDAQVAIPLWPPILLFGALALFLFRRDRRLRHVGHCLNCRYDVRSLPESSPCPECASTKRIAP